MGRSEPVRKNLGQQWKVEDERKPDVDPRLRVMERFREFLYVTNRDSIM